METEISLPHSQVPATSPYPEHIDPAHAPLPLTKHCLDKENCIMLMDLVHTITYLH